MGPVLSLILIGACIIIAVGAVAIWMAAKRPVQSLERRQRNEALAASDRYTPAPRSSPYGQPVPPDPCAPGLSDHERVLAMRALLLKGDAQAAEADLVDGFAPTQPGFDDEVMTTSPMAWKPTLPPDEAEIVDRRRSVKPRVREGQPESVSHP
jgi:hypothetical protein